MAKITTEICIGEIQRWLYKQNLVPPFPIKRGSRTKNKDGNIVRIFEIERIEQKTEKIFHCYGMCSTITNNIPTGIIMKVVTIDDGENFVSIHQE